MCSTTASTSRTRPPRGLGRGALPRKRAPSAVERGCEGRRGVSEGSSVARGLAGLAIGAVLFVFTLGLAGVVGPWTGVPEPACGRPVEIDANGALRIGCATDPELATCGALAAASRVRLDASGCRVV